MLVLGLRVLPSGLLSIGELEDCSSYGKLMFLTETEQQMSVFVAISYSMVTQYSVPDSVISSHSSVEVTEAKQLICLWDS